MKLLLDQNISYKVIRPLSKFYTEILQVGRLGMAQTEDAMIWQYALTHELTIVTFDSYFQDRNIQAGHPLKIIHLNCNNTSTENIIRIMIDNVESIKNFISEGGYSCLEIKD
jgi:predicted nuclease of predicted toxin-antitoxin system